MLSVILILSDLCRPFQPKGFSLWLAFRRRNINALSYSAITGDLTASRDNVAGVAVGCGSVRQFRYETPKTDALVKQNQATIRQCERGFNHIDSKRPVH